MKKHEILAKIKSLATLNFEDESKEDKSKEDKSKDNYEKVSKKFKVEEEVDGEKVEVEYEVSYEDELKVGSEVEVSKDGEAIESYSGKFEIEKNMITVDENKVTKIDEIEQEEEEGSEDNSDNFTEEFSQEVLDKFTKLNETLEKVINKNNEYKKENVELEKKVNELNKSVEDFSKQEVDNREEKTYSVNDFLKDPKLKY